MKNFIHELIKIRYYALCITYDNFNFSILKQCLHSDTSLNQEPFYLHPPSSISTQTDIAPQSTTHAPQDGLYVNPIGVSEVEDTPTPEFATPEGFYLHHPRDVIYNRVKDLFGNRGQITGKKLIIIQSITHLFKSFAPVCPQK